jgi:hypothetical protein
MEITVARLGAMLQQVQQGIVIERTAAIAKELSRLGDCLPDYEEGSTVVNGVKELVASFKQGPSQQQ